MDSLPTRSQAAVPGRSVDGARNPKGGESSGEEGGRCLASISVAVESLCEGNGGGSLLLPAVVDERKEKAAGVLMSWDSTVRIPVRGPGRGSVCEQLLQITPLARTGYIYSFPRLFPH